MKIIVVGAGIGGIVAAEKLGKLGFSVTVYEKAASLDDMRYDWHDDVSPKVFRRLGIDIPVEHFKKRSWTFCSPFEHEVREFTQDETDPDLSIERRPLNKLLFERAVQHAEFIFGATVSAPVVEGGRVVGVVVDGKEIECDLVVDSAGVYSPVRRGLPKELNISEIAEDEIFTAYRAFYRRAEGSPDPKYTNKVYMKDRGEAGIAWTILDNDPTQVNVLVGRVGALDPETLKETLSYMREKNPILGDEIVRGGFNCIIPVRYPATRMVASGYVAIGDAAYMTIPLLGSGIASSMLAAEILAETVGANMSNGVKGKNLFDLRRLWKYQVNVFREFGAVHAGVDVMKRWMLTQTDETVDWLFGSKILNNNDLQKVAGGGLVKIGVKDAIEKVNAVGLGKISVLLKMNNMLMRCNKAERIGKNIPRNFNENTVCGWERRLKRVYKTK